MTNNSLKIGITIGDLNGIGIEIIIKTFLDARMLQTCTPIIYGSSKTISFHRKALEANDFNYNTIRHADAAIAKKINVVNCWEEEVKIDLGQSTETSAKYAFKSLEAITADLVKKKIDVLVTAPINKYSIHQIGFNFPGHTEYFTEKFNQDKSKPANSLMFMVSKNMKVGIVTGHTPVQKISSCLTIETILQKIRIMNKSLLQDFGIIKPKIAVLGLNPHASDNGLLGNEENEIIIPAIKKAVEENILTFGPYAADGFFGSSQYAPYDGILAMYHDQGLIPFKGLSFTTGVNFTAGLPVIRTSPDHGTGFDIAGKNLANEESFREAVYCAQDIFNKRKEYTEISANPLPSSFSKF